MLILAGGQSFFQPIQTIFISFKSVCIYAFIRFSISTCFYGWFKFENVCRLLLKYIHTYTDYTYMLLKLSVDSLTFLPEFCLYKYRFHYFGLLFFLQKTLYIILD